MKPGWLIAFGAVFVVAAFLFTYKLLQVPPGIETDEGVIAHNAALISKTLRDQNGRFMPVFVLSADKMDWKQPVMIYLTAVFFKVFGVSLGVFKLVNVTVALAAMVVMWLVLKMLFESKFVTLGLVIFMTTPIVVIAARIGTETIYPVFFAALWLLAFGRYDKKPRVLWMALGALALGASFYSYKSMRLIIPPWAVLSTLFIIWKKRSAAHALMFILILLPFLAVTPWLEQKYAGAIFDRRQVGIESYRHYAYYWLANLGTAFLFVQSGPGKIFVVEKFGTLLLGALPFFLIGIKKAVEKSGFWLFVLLAFLTTPMLFGMAGSENYGHRLAAMVPLYVIITALGFQTIWNTRKEVAILLSLFYAFNFGDFVKYYYFKYPLSHDTRVSFPNNLDQAYYQLSKQAKKTGFTPYVQRDIHERHGEGNLFFEAAYFDKALGIWKLGQELPKNSVLLTQSDTLEGMRKMDIDVTPLKILRSE